MSQQIASLYAEIGAKVDGFQAGAKTVKSEMSSIASQFGLQIPASVLQFTTLGGAVTAVGAALYSMEKAADAAARGDARLAAVLQSTGNAAGYNFEQLDMMADSLSKVVGVDDDLIKKSMAVTATFTNISGSIFPAATKAALDLSAVLGGDLQSATIQVDKALNDFSGYTALKRAGVSFSEEQIRQIENFKETNNLVGYQKLILAELTKEFGGAAKAIHDAGDRSEDVAIAWGNLTEKAGGGLVPAMRGLNIYITESINGWNAFFQGLQRADNGLSQVINTVGELSTYLIAPVRILKTISDWGNQMNTNNEAANAMDDLSIAVDEAASSNRAYVPTAEEVEAANKAISDANMGLIDTIQSMQDAEERFSKRSVDLARDREEAENNLREAVANNADLTAEEYNKLMGKIEEVKQKEAELAAERDRQALQYVSNILLQKLEMDGLTTAEFEAFAKQQEAWGLWSADVVEKAQAAWMEADKIAASIGSIPVEKTVTITTVHNDVYGQPGGKIGPPKPPGYTGGESGGSNRWLGGVEQPMDTPTRKPKPTNDSGWVWDNGAWVWGGGFWDNPFAQGGISLGTAFGNGHASGGSFMVPMSYGNEGFRMGNGDTASGGELITVTPKNNVGNQQSFDYDRMARLFAMAVRDALLTTGR